jgi:hypothetical protein
MTREQLAGMSESDLSFMLEVIEEADRTNDVRYVIILDELKSRAGVPTSDNS